MLKGLTFTFWYQYKYLNAKVIGINSTVSGLGYMVDLDQ
jgi:hypothetical protein